MELTISGIQKVYESNQGEPNFHLELPDIKFDFSATTYIMGHNGSGKSLFLKLLTGEVNPATGFVCIEFDGKKHKLNEIAVAIVRQKAEENLFLSLSVEENLLLRLQVESMLEKLFPKKYLNQKISNSIFGQEILIRKMKQVCEELSGGQKQLLAFHTATAQKSRILCLDEFLSSTDYGTSILLREKTKQYAKKNNACVLIVSHDFNTALEDADRIIILNNGKLSAQLEKNSSNWNRQTLVEMVHMVQ